MVEHSISVRHHIRLHNTSILSIKPQYMDHIIREVTDIELYPSNMNRKDDFCFTWNLSSPP
jgi:hypothetical protein